MLYMAVSLIRQDAYTKGYVGLSTDTKVTTGMNDGDTFLEADSGDTYVFCTGTWYNITTPE